MRRREFIASLGAIALMPAVSRAQQSGGLIPRVGILLTLTRGNPDGQARVTAFRQGLEALGWKDGHNVRLEERWPGEDRRALDVAAADLVAQSPAVIMVGGSRALIAIQQKTKTIPIVFVAAAGTVEHGVVTNAARPRGNLTGFTTYDDFALVGKLLGTLKEAYPGLARALTIMHQDHPSIAGYESHLLAAASRIGVQANVAVATNASEMERLVAAFAAAQHGGLVLPPDQFNILHRDLIIGLAQKYRLPAIYGYRSHVVAGGLLSYGTDISELNRRAAGYVDRILKGERPQDLPVQSPTKYELAINLKTAKMLGVEIPASLLARADEVVE